MRWRQVSKLGSRSAEVAFWYDLEKPCCCSAEGRNTELAPTMISFFIASGRWR